MKRILTLAAAAALACGSTSSNNAAVSRNNPGAGSNNCNTVRQVLQQVADSRAGAGCVSA